jgi:hypothetical protein
MTTILAGPRGWRSLIFEAASRYVESVMTVDPQDYQFLAPRPRCNAIRKHVFDENGLGSGAVARTIGKGRGHCPTHGTGQGQVDKRSTASLFEPGE